MLFFEELILEILVQPILRFVFDHFVCFASTFDDEQYKSLQESTYEMLETVNLFLKYPGLVNDLESYDCQNPVSFNNLNLKATDMSKSQPRKEWLAELEKYKLYVRQYSEIRLHSVGKEEKLAEVVLN